MPTRLHLALTKSTAGLGSATLLVPRTGIIQCAFIFGRGLIQNLSTLQNYSCQIELNLVGTLSIAAGSNFNGVDTIAGVQWLTQLGTAAANLSDGAFNEQFYSLEFPVSAGQSLYLLANNDANLTTTVDAIVIIR